jgi:hypothetical protein
MDKRKIAKFAVPPFAALPLIGGTTVSAMNNEFVSHAGLLSGVIDHFMVGAGTFGATASCGLAGLAAGGVLSFFIVWIHRSTRAPDQQVKSSLKSQFKKLFVVLGGAGAAAGSVFGAIYGYHNSSETIQRGVLAVPPSRAEKTSMNEAAALRPLGLPDGRRAEIRNNQLVIRQPIIR